jgi:hypothetical protein
MLRRNDPVNPACNPREEDWPSCALRSHNQEKLMDYRYVVRILVVEDHRLWQELVAKELQEHPNPNLQMNAIADTLGYVHKSHVRRTPLQRALWGTPLFSERSWWALTIALGVLIGLLLVRSMR